jgi:hypothetical protein
MKKNVLRTSIGQILESTDLGVVSADTFCDLRAG